MIKWNNKYSYPSSSRSIQKGSRLYSVGNQTMIPSVTTILEITKPDSDKEQLAKWVAKVGEAESKRIASESSSRGTALHSRIENFLKGKLNGDLLEEKNLAQKMADEIIENGIRDKVSEIYGCEVTVFQPDPPNRFAGTADCIAEWNGKISILDFKQTNKQKRKEWILSYLLQLSAYAIAHNRVYNTKIDRGVILMCATDLTFQEFVVEGDEFLELQKEFKKRVELYYQLQAKG